MLFVGPFDFQRRSICHIPGHVFLTLSGVEEGDANPLLLSSFGNLTLGVDAIAYWFWREGNQKRLEHIQRMTGTSEAGIFWENLRK